MNIMLTSASERSRKISGGRKTTATGPEFLGSASFSIFATAYPQSIADANDIRRRPNN